MSIPSQKAQFATFLFHSMWSRPQVNLSLVAWCCQGKALWGMIHCCAPVPDAPTDRRNCLRQIHILCVRRSSVSHGSVHAPVQTSKLKHYIPSRELIYPTSKKRKIRTSSSQVPWCGICDRSLEGTKNLPPWGYTVKRLLRFDVEFVVVTVVEFKVKICCSMRCCVSLICCNCFVSLA